MEKTYSFIIPHHNTPRLLQRLVDSIPQREDIEIIVVDDNSDDDKKANAIRSDVRSIYIDKEHTKGAGKARNVGMKAATGKWLLFADADDFYQRGFIDILDEYKEDDIEILFFNVGSVDSNTLLPGKINRAAYLDKLIKAYQISNEKADDLLFLGYGPWRKMLSREYVRKYGFQFEEIPIDNDNLFSLETSYFARKWKVDSRIVYVLTYYDNSITYSTLSKDKCIAHLKVLERRASFNKYIGHPEWNKKCARGRYVHSCFFFCCRKLISQPWAGIKCWYYYLTNWFYIKEHSNKYIDILDNLKNQDRND